MAQKEEKRKEGTKESGKMTVEEAGRKGGETTKETHGREFYQEIGKKGGTSEKRRSTKGGEVVVKRSGKDIDVTFSSEQEAQDWESGIRPMLEESGYHFTRVKPAAEAAETAAGE